MSRCLALLAALVLAACASGPAPLPPVGEPTHRLWVTSNDWHTRIVVEEVEVPDGVLPERADLAPAGWLAMAWGDHEYYPMHDPPTLLAVKAALLPSASVVHLIPMAGPPVPFEGFEVLAIGVSEEGLVRMLEAIDGEIDRGGAERAEVAADGLLPGSLFYPATGTFHLFNTCNTWTARMLQNAGLPIRSAAVITAEDLMRQLRPLPQVAVARG